MMNFVNFLFFVKSIYKFLYCYRLEEDQNKFLQEPFETWVFKAKSQGLLAVVIVGFQRLYIFKLVQGDFFFKEKNLAVDFHLLLKIKQFLVNIKT